MPEGWGRTPIIYLPGDSGWTSLPEKQDPWERGLAVMGIDFPDGWRDMEAWRWYDSNVLHWWRTRAAVKPLERTVRHRVTTKPDVTSMGLLGLARPPRGLVTRFYVTQNLGTRLPKPDSPWFVIDTDKGEPASGTRQSGYRTKAEAVEVAEDLAANRERIYSRVPF